MSNVTFDVERFDPTGVKECGIKYKVKTDLQHRNI
jgi:hypothetical protein